MTTPLSDVSAASPSRTRVRPASRLVVLLLGGLLALGGLPAFAQQDPPGRVGSLTYQQGAVTFSPAGDSNWYDVVPNRPVTTGDRLWTDNGARAELSVGSTALRMDEQTAVSIDQLDDSTARITASQGELQVRVREPLLAGQRLEVDTDNFAVVIDAPGDYRIASDPAAGTSQVAVAAGQVTLYGEGGESVPLGAHQQLATTGRNLVAVSGSPMRTGTSFDRWVAERDRMEDQSVAARYVSRDMVGYQQLDGNGDWQTDPTYGEVWFPHNTDADWAPYSDGQWVDVAPWGWTWVDAAPWGFATAHYGRWARFGPRWGWVPGREQARPVYSPALVGFVGGAAGASLAIGGGRNGVGWFPLAPGEPWQPGYRASQRYVEAANRGAVQRFDRLPMPRNVAFANQQMPGAVTVVPSDAFGRGPIGRQNAVRLPPNQLAGVPVAMAAPVAPHGERGVGAFGRPVAVAPPVAMPALGRTTQQPFQQLQPPIQPQPGFPQRGGPQQMQAIQAQQIQQGRQMQEAQQLQQMQQAQRQQQEMQQRGAQAQAQQAQQMQQAQQAQQAQQLQRQQQEFQQRAVQAQALQRQQAEQAQQAQQMQQAQQRQMAERQQQEMQQRAQQAQQMQQMQQQQAQREAQAQQMQMQMRQQQQQQAERMQQEMQQRQAQAQQMQAQQQQQAMRAQQQMQAQAQQAQQVQRALQAQQAHFPQAPHPQGQPGQAQPEKP